MCSEAIFREQFCLEIFFFHLRTFKEMILEFKRKPFGPLANISTARLKKLHCMCSQNCFKKIHVLRMFSFFNHFRDLNKNKSHFRQKKNSAQLSNVLSSCAYDHFDDECLHWENNHFLVIWVKNFWLLTKRFAGFWQSLFDSVVKEEFSATGESICGEFNKQIWSFFSLLGV